MEQRLASLFRELWKSAKVMFDDPHAAPRKKVSGARRRKAALYVAHTGHKRLRIATFNRYTKGIAEKRPDTWTKTP